MGGHSYYEFQGSARGLATSADIDAAARTAARTYRRLLGDWLPHEKDAYIYEAGCGPGIMLRYLTSEGFTNLFGSDISSREVSQARETRAHIALADSQMDLMSQPPESFDRIIAIDFIEHLSRDQVVDFLVSSGRALKASGSLILRMPSGDSPIVGRNLFNDITHVWAYTPTAIDALLRMAGFESVEFRDESVASIDGARWAKVPVMLLARSVIRLSIRVATANNILYLGPSLFVRAYKGMSGTKPSGAASGAMS